MAASFRNKDEIINLAGCDKLTISPALLEDLNQTPGDLEPKLTSQNALAAELKRINVNESSFRWHLNENQMASFKLAEGIRLFNKDMLKLKDLIKSQL
jgi:transaldolase